MRIPLDFESDNPLYEQITTYLRQAILSGNLAPETRLAASRELAEELGISRTTVENAYATLEMECLVLRRVGSGTYVLPPVGSDLLRSGQRPGQHTPPDWPLWQRELQQTDGKYGGSSDLTGLGASRYSPPQVSQVPQTTQSQQTTIAFTGFGDPRRFPVKDFGRAIKSVLHAMMSAHWPWVTSEAMHRYAPPPPISWPARGYPSVQMRF